MQFRAAGRPVLPVEHLPVTSVRRGDVQVDAGLRADGAEGVAVGHLVNGDLAGSGQVSGGDRAVGQQRVREDGGQEAGAGTGVAHGHPDDRRRRPVQQLEDGEHVRRRLCRAHQLHHVAAVAQRQVGTQQVGGHGVVPVLRGDDLGGRAAPAAYRVEAAGFHVDVGGPGVVGGAQDGEPFRFRPGEPAALAFRAAGQHQRHRGRRHQLVHVEAGHQVQADLGQADPGGQALELAQAGVRVLRGERGCHLIAGHRGSLSVARRALLRRPRLVGDRRYRR